MGSNPGVPTKCPEAKRSGGPVRGPVLSRIIPSLPTARERRDAARLLFLARRDAIKSARHVPRLDDRVALIHARRLMPGNLHGDDLGHPRIGQPPRRRAPEVKDHRCRYEVVVTAESPCLDRVIQRRADSLVLQAIAR